MVEASAVEEEKKQQPSGLKLLSFFKRNEKSKAKEKDHPSRS